MRLGRPQWRRRWRLDVIGREEELGAIQAFLAEVEHGPGRARALRRGRDRQDDPLGGGRRGGARTGFGSRPDLPRRRGRGLALVRRRSRSCSRPCSTRSAPSLRAAAPAGARGRAAARRAGRVASGSARDRARRARRAARPGRARPGASSRSTTCSGSTRPRPACSRSRSGGCARSRVGLLATLRHGTGDREPVRARARRSRRSGSSGSTLGPLSLGAVHRLLEERLGLELTRPELARVQEATAGNPFFALELGRELVRTDTRPAPGQALRVPESLRELLGGRLARLPAETLDVLLQVAALARPTVELVAAAYGERGARARGARGGCRERASSSSTTSRMRFAHPLLASICYEQAPVWKRRAVHRALAGAVSDVEERARHLALAADGPGRAVAVRAGDRRRAGGRAWGARRRGRALRARRRADAGRSRRSRGSGACGRRTFHRLAGDGERAVDDARAAPRARCRSGVERADVLFELAVTQRGDARALIELLRRGAGRGGGRRRALCADPGPASRTRTCSQADVRGGARRRPGGAGEGRAGRRPGAARRGHRVRGAGRDVQRPRSRRVCSSAASRSRSGSGWSSSGTSARATSLARRLMRLGETDRARAILEELEAQALARGDESSRAMASGRCACSSGSPAAGSMALEHAAAAYELDRADAASARRATGSGGPRRSSRRTSASSRRRAPRPRKASRSRRRARSSSSPSSRWACSAASSSRSATWRRPASYLRELPGRLLAGGMNDPTLPVWADAIETLDRPRRARAGARLPRAVRAATPAARKPLGDRVRCRCRGLLAAAEGDLGGGVRGVRARPGRAASASVPARARPHAALPRHGAQAGAAEEGGPGGARAGARDLRGAGRAAVGGEGAGGAQADQRPRAGLRRADRDGAASRRARGRRAARTRRSPPSSSWA